jgi:hypothetical protein
MSPRGLARLAALERRGLTLDDRAARLERAYGIASQQAGRAWNRPTAWPINSPSTYAYTVTATWPDGRFWRRSRSTSDRTTWLNGLGLAIASTGPIQYLLTDSAGQIHFNVPTGAGNWSINAASLFVSTPNTSHALSEHSYTEPNNLPNTNSMEWYEGRYSMDWFDYVYIRYGDSGSWYRMNNLDFDSQRQNWWSYVFSGYTWEFRPTSITAGGKTWNRMQTLRRRLGGSIVVADPPSSANYDIDLLTYSLGGQQVDIRLSAVNLGATTTF